MSYDVASRPTWLRSETPRPHAAFRLFCLPHAGGTSALYRGWGAALPADIEVRAFVLPGREERIAERAASRLDAFVAPLAQIIAEHADRPYALFGHSMGGLVAFEVARALRRLGAPGPCHLFLSASRPPHLWHEFEHIHALPEPAFRLALARMGGMPAELLREDEIMSMLSPMLRRDFELIANYQFTPDAPLNVPLTVLAAVDDTVMPFLHLYEWQRHTRAPFRLRTFSGGHFYLTECRQALLDVVARALRPVAPTPPGTQAPRSWGASPESV